MHHQRGFITIALEMNRVVTVQSCHNLIEKLLEKDWFDACSKMITMKSTSNKSYPYLLTTTKMDL